MAIPTVHAFHEVIMLKQNVNHENNGINNSLKGASHKISISRCLAETSSEHRYVEYVMCTSHMNIYWKPIYSAYNYRFRTMALDINN